MEAVPATDTNYFYIYDSDEAIAAFLEASGGSLTELSLNNIISVRYQVINMPYLIKLLPFAFVCTKIPIIRQWLLNDSQICCLTHFFVLESQMISFYDIDVACVGYFSFLHSILQACSNW